MVMLAFSYSITSIEWRGLLRVSHISFFAIFSPDAPRGGKDVIPDVFFLRDFGTGWALTSSRLSELEHSCGVSLCYATLPRVPFFASVAKPTFDTSKTPFIVFRSNAQGLYMGTQGRNHG
jgi:hypothetical protein